MGRFFKILALVVAAFAALFIFAAIGFLLFFDANDFREDIATAVEDRTGRTLVIEGDVSLSIFPWLAVEVGKARLGNAPGFGEEPFAEFDRANLSIRLMPMLLRREIAVGRAELDALRLNLAVARDGKSNWADLVPEGGEEVAAEAESAGDGGGRLDVSGVDVVDASIIYDDRQAGAAYRLTDVNMKVGRISDDRQPVPASGSLRFAIEPDGMSGEIEIDTVVAFDRDTSVVTFDGLTIDGVIEGLANSPTRLAFETAGIEVETGAKNVTLQPLDLTLLGIDVSADVEPFSYAGEVLPKAKVSIGAFSPRSIMQLFDVEAPETADPVALSSVAIDGNAALTGASVELTGLTIKIDDTTFRGSMSVPRSSAGGYRFDLEGDSIDLNRYMGPPSEGAAGNGEAAPMEIPADLIRPLNARGTVGFATVRLGNLQLDNVALGLNTGGGRMRLHPISADLYGGKYDGDVRIDVADTTPVLSLDENVEGVDLAKLARAMFEKDNITGSVNGHFKLSGRGSNIAEVQRDLGGTMDFELRDGTYEGTDVWYELRRARAVLKKETPPEPVLPARTRFTSVSATGVVTKGVMRNEDFVAALPFMELTGAGSVNIPEATVDYRMRARVFKKPEALQNATEAELDDFTKVVIPLRITGPVAKPKVTPDVEDLLKKRVEEEVKERLEDKLKDLFKKKE